MEENPLKSELRREGRSAKFGEKGVCCLCGYANPMALILVDRTLLEQHHALGRVHDPVPTLPMCRNCHAELTAGLLDAGADMHKQLTFLDRLAMILRALGTLFIAIGEAMFRHANEIIGLIDALDKSCRRWRRLREAR